MKKLKTRLLFSLYIFALINTIYIVKNEIIKSNFKDDTSQIKGYINDYNFDGNSLKIYLKSKELIICTYYIDNYNELVNLKNKIRLGLVLELNGEINSPNRNSNFNSFNYRSYLLSKRINWTFKITKIKLLNNKIQMKYKIKNFILDRINNSKSKEYLNLFILGKNDLDSDIKDSYRAIGISHLFAISGMHITLLTTFIYKIMNLLIKNKKIIIIFIIFFLLGYMFLANFSPSVIRASLLFVLINIKKIYNINIDNSNILLLILSILLIYNPYYIYDLGFLFSFTVSYTLIRFNNIISKYNNYIINLFITSLISFIASIPIMILGFNQVNILSPFINCIFVPLVSIIIFPLSILTFFIPILAFFLNHLINIMEYFSTFFSNFNMFTIILPSVCIFALILYSFFIYFTIKSLSLKRILILLLVLLVHSNIHLVNKYPIITMIDVGQGDSILIELPYNKGNILIDVGGITSYETDEWKKKKTTYSVAKNTIIPYLKSIGIKKINYLILTHGDYDHAGEAINFINNFSVGNVIFNSGNDVNLEKSIKEVLTLKNIKYISVSKYILNIKDYEFSFINDKDITNENEDSLIIYTKLNGKNILLMGDTGISSEKYIIGAYNLEKMNILKVGHHGSKNSTSLDFLNSINPDIALISAGLNNKFGHPNKETTDKLHSKKIDTYVTNINGMIRIILKEEVDIDFCF